MWARWKVIRQAPRRATNKKISEEIKEQGKQKKNQKDFRGGYGRATVTNLREDEQTEKERRKAKMSSSRRAQPVRKKYHN